MKRIIKRSSPVGLEEWKLTKGRVAKYKNIPAAIKEELRESLSTEQYGLCCYCGISLRNGNIHIEHFKPQSQFPGQALNYQNLHASCMGKLYIPSEVEELDFCGHEKREWYNSELLVSPLDPDCESYFLYGFDGSVSDNHHAASKETIKRLQLDKYLLRTQRQAAIDSALEVIDISDTLEIQEYISFLNTPNEQGELQDFSYIVSGLLKTLI